MNYLRSAILALLIFSSAPFEAVAQWVQTNGPCGGQVYSFAVSGTNLFVGTAYAAVWRRPLSEMITSVERLSANVPLHFSLAQNYPNPFNPTTNFEFGISDLGFVSLKVFDVLGREVATLVNEERQPGIYRVTWDASKMPSGVYFYTLRAGDASTRSARGFVETKKMILTK